jgi:hypothetical protein
MSTRRAANNISRREHPNAPLQVMPRRLVRLRLMTAASCPRHCFANWPHHISGMQNNEISFREHRGWVDGEEVVQVHFEPREVSRPDLDSYARAEGFSPIESGGFELDREPQFYLRKTGAAVFPTAMDTIHVSYWKSSSCAATTYYFDCRSHRVTPTATQGNVWRPK